MTVLPLQIWFPLWDTSLPIALVMSEIASPRNKRIRFIFKSLPDSRVSYQGEDDETLVGYIEAYDPQTKTLILTLANDCGVLVRDRLYGSIKILCKALDEDVVRVVSWKPFA